MEEFLNAQQVGQVRQFVFISMTILLNVDKSTNIKQLQYTTYVTSIHNIILILRAECPLCTQQSVFKFMLACFDIHRGDQIQSSDAYKPQGLSNLSIRFSEYALELDVT